MRQEQGLFSKLKSKMPNGQMKERIIIDDFDNIPDLLLDDLSFIFNNDFSNSNTEFSNSYGIF